MYEIALRSCIIAGFLPPLGENKFVVKCNRIVAVLWVIFVLWQIVATVLRFVEELQKQLAVTFVGVLMRIIDCTVWLIICCRRIVNGMNEAKVLNSLFETTVRGQFRDIGVIWLTGALVPLVERTLTSYGVVFGDSYIYKCDLTLLLRLGFECSMIIVLETQEFFYNHTNESVRQQTFYRNDITLRVIRSKYEKMHSIRIAVKESFSSDLVLYFADSQQNMLLECLDLAKALAGESVDLLRVGWQCITFTRLLAVMSYVIWRWQRVSDEMELLIENIQTRDQLFLANKYYDINMTLLYNISGTVFAYFLLIIITIAVNPRQTV